MNSTVILTTDSDDDSDDDRDAKRAERWNASRVQRWA